MISISYDQSSENGSMRSNSGKAKAASASIVKGNFKTPKSSTGLSLRKVNTDQRGVTAPAFKKPVVTMPKKEEDDPEFMPNIMLEKDNYADILPFDERPSAAALQRILCAPVGQREQDKENLDLLTKHRSAPIVCHYSDSGLGDEMIAEETSEPYEPCSLDDIIQLDEDHNEKDGVRKRHEK